MVKAVKIYFGEEVRRVGAEHLTQNWDSFVTRLQELLGRNIGLDSTGQYFIQYQDDESDWVNMNTTEELQEAFRTPVDVLKILVNKSPDQPTPTQVPPTVVAPTIPITIPPTVVHPPSPTKPTIHYSQVPFTYPACAEPSSALNSKAVELMNQGKLGAARDVLESAVLRYPDNHVFYYNLACVHSLMGDADSAISCLHEAVERGYTRLGHMLVDTDLENIREHPEFKNLVESLAHKCSSKSPFANLGRLATQVALSIWPDNSHVLYNAAKAEASENVDRAGELLSRAVEAGWNNAQAILEEPVFQGLLQLPVFQTIINGMLMTPREPTQQRNQSQSSPPVEEKNVIPEDIPPPPTPTSAPFVPTQCPTPVQVAPPTPTIQRPSPDITTFPSVELPTQAPVPQSTPPQPISSSIYPIIPIETPESSIASTPSSPATPLTPVPIQVNNFSQEDSSSPPEPEEPNMGIDAGYKYFEQVATLWGMGFFDVPLLRSLLDKYNGNVSRVVFDLI